MSHWNFHRDGNETGSISYTPSVDGAFEPWRVGSNHFNPQGGDHLT
jgi:hypothetical protein